MSSSPGFDPYAMLQVVPTADQEVVHAAFKALALKYHPDHDATRRAATKMADLNRAYAILRDERSRAAHDRSQRRVVAGVSVAASRPGSEPPPARPSAGSVLGFGRYTGWSLRDLADAIRTTCSGGPATHRASATAPRSTRSCGRWASARPERASARFGRHMSPSREPVRAVFLDIGDTVMRPNPSWEAVYAVAFAEYGIEVSVDDLHTALRRAYHHGGCGWRGRLRAIRGDELPAHGRHRRGGHRRARHRPDAR